MSPTSTEPTKRRGRKPSKGGTRLRMFQMRMNDEEWQHLNAAAARRGMKVAVLVRAQLGDLLGPRPAVSPGGPSAPDPTESTDQPPHPAQTGTLDLAGWLAAQTGMPESVARLYVESGRVTVAGKVRRDAEIAADLADLVALDGALVLHAAEAAADGRGEEADNDQSADDAGATTRDRDD